MENQPLDENIGYVFQWKIENKINCWLKQGEVIKSPTFFADALESTKWYLSLYPMGLSDEYDVGCCLHREDESGPLEIRVNFQFAFLDKNGSTQTTFERSHTFKKPGRLSFLRFITQGEVFFHRRYDFLPDDTLTVQCMIWNTEMPEEPKYLYARTVFKATRRSSLWSIDGFSTARPILRHKVKGNLIDFDLVLNGTSASKIEKKLAININSYDESVKYFSFKISVIDSDGKKEQCGTLEYFADDLKCGLLPPMLLAKNLLFKKSQYFPNDVLRLHCEYLISTQTNLYELPGTDITSPKLTNEVLEIINKHYIENDELVNTPILINDLKLMYNDANFADVELKTSTRNFPAHKAILSARSPVFRKMFGHEMKEKSSGQVEITDLDNDTVYRMLLYMYTDSLTDLQYESALKLYSAAEKYHILPLKYRCCYILKKHLCPAKACEFLLRADQHQDVDLKCFVQDYIIEHDKEIFGSQEWEDFMETNTTLAADTMYRQLNPL